MVYTWTEPPAMPLLVAASVTVPVICPPGCSAALTLVLSAPAVTVTSVAPVAVG